MKRYAFDWVDAFTDRAFGGNGCAVVHDGAALDAATCKAFVRETSLVECTFTGPSDVADVRVRYFLATGEIPFAGHPTIATVSALLARGFARGDRLTLETGAGVVPITIEGDLIEMTQAAPQFGIMPGRAVVAGAAGLPVDAILGEPQVVSTGLPFCIAVLRDHDALRAARLDPEAMASFKAACGVAVDDVLEPFLVTLQGATERGDTFSRLLLPPPMPPEDPFTGSATGAMAAYLWANGLMDHAGFTAEQGHWMGRPGLARVTRVGTPDAMSGVKVAGRGYVLMQGDVILPASAEV
ncbi:PhzF family phenazine biosynthesis protein [Marinibacterium sp. SX1]|uniref:PhzF family phenazine biosynthesis protein n=1 Tax=Marinibacterium sp. SX1 TaxID=3388424 RepID=UPI003D1851A1